MQPEGTPEPPKPSLDKQLDILNDHYKDTFTRLRETAQTRDRLFLWLIALFALLTVEIGYPAAVAGSLGKVNFFGAELNLQSLPLPALLTLTWVVVLLIGLQYCQATVWINRQYDYVHHLEHLVSPMLGGGDTYQREGEVYLRNYPLVLNFAWIIYGFVFPALIMLGTLWLLIWELVGLSYPAINQALDGFLGVVLIMVFFSYRMEPTIKSAWEKIAGFTRERARSLAPTIVIGIAVIVVLLIVSARG
jgi:hypothetical protein